MISQDSCYFIKSSFNLNRYMLCEYNAYYGDVC